MSDPAEKRRSAHNQHLSTRKLSRVAHEREHPPRAQHLSARKLKKLERDNGDSPTLKAILLIGLFFLVLEGLHVFSLWIRAQRAFEAFWSSWITPIIEFFSF